jgi:hypothetical protein
MKFKKSGHGFYRAENGTLYTAKQKAMYGKMMNKRKTKVLKAYKEKGEQ